jgi:hypothetical protein
VVNSITTYATWAITQELSSRAHIEVKCHAAALHRLPPMKSGTVKVQHSCTPIIILTLQSSILGLFGVVSCSGKAVDEGATDFTCPDSTDCNICSDGKWHCEGEVLPPCTPDAVGSSGSCSGSCRLGQSCLVCRGGVPAKVSCGSGGYCAYDLIMGATCPP